jgi:hypothetical protein
MNHPSYLVDFVLFVGLLLAAVVQLVGLCLIVWGAIVRRAALFRRGVVLVFSATLVGRYHVRRYWRSVRRNKTRRTASRSAHVIADGTALALIADSRLRDPLLPGRRTNTLPMAISNERLSEPGRYSSSLFISARCTFQYKPHCFCLSFTQFRNWYGSNVRQPHLFNSSYQSTLTSSQASTRQLSSDLRLPT